MSKQRRQRSMSKDDYIQQLEHDLASKDMQIDQLRQALTSGGQLQIITPGYTEAAYQRGVLQHLEHQRRLYDESTFETIDFIKLTMECTRAMDAIDLLCGQLTGSLGENAYSKIREAFHNLYHLNGLLITSKASFTQDPNVEAFIQSVRRRLEACTMLFEQNDGGAALRKIASQEGTRYTAGIEEFYNSIDFGGVRPLEYTDYLAACYEALKVPNRNSANEVAQEIIRQIEKLPENERTDAQRAALQKLLNKPYEKRGKVVYDAWYNTTYKSVRRHRN